MGKYRGAVVTTAGQNLIAEALTGGSTITWTTAEASSYSYPSSIDLQTLTSLQNVEQTANIGSAGVYSTNILQVSTRFDNTGVTDPYLIETIGVYARLGTGSPVLVAVVAADTPDQMPEEDIDSPTAFLYNIQMQIQNAESLTITVDPAGAASVADVQYVQQQVTVNAAAIAQNAQTISDHWDTLRANFARVETTDYASQAYSIGDHLVTKNGVFCTVTNAIANGGQITIGTNVSAAPVGAELDKKLNTSQLRLSGTTLYITL